MCSGVDPSRNVSKMVDAIAETAAAGAVMYFAPEMSLLLDRDRSRARSKIFAEADTPWLGALREAARVSGVWVHLGSMAVVHEDGSGRLANRSLVIDDGGEIRARYDKIHMFDVQLAGGERWQESASYRAGEQIAAVQTPAGLLGLTICYDIRFADIFSALARTGVDIIAAPSAFTRPTGLAHWETLLRARAIETQSFVVAAAQAGLHEDGRETYGHSLVIGPWGDVIADLGEDEKLTIIDLSIASLVQARSQIPVQVSRKKLNENVLIYR